MPKIAVISTSPSNDFIKILKKNKIDFKLLLPNDVSNHSFSEFVSIAILGGDNEEPLILNPKARMVIEHEIENGKKVFGEYCGSLGNFYMDNIKNTRYERLVCVSRDIIIDGINLGDILDEQCNTRIVPVDFVTNKDSVILSYTRHNTHDKVPVNQIKYDTVDQALWFEKPNNLLLCSFRLCNFIKARFSPKDKFKYIIKYIMEWLTDNHNINMDHEEEYMFLQNGVNNSFKMDLNNTIDNAVAWFYNAEILLDNGENGVIEGLSTEIYPDGKQKPNKTIRADCIGEIAFALFLYYKLVGDRNYLLTYDNLINYLFNYMQIKNIFYNGMIRWSNVAWGTCYQDDVSRAIIPTLLISFLYDDDKFLNNSLEALNFLIKTTGTDGLRIFRTDNVNLDKNRVYELKNKPGNFPCAHYNAYYHAALLMAYKVTGSNIFKCIAIKGLESIMKVYPDTVREQSETEELCRLILPLSWLYFITKDPLHKNWLYKVVSDLQKFKHMTGAYLEWDNGYKANMRNSGGKGECSILTRNGDPIVDLLYSNNWLPLGFITAYYVTGDAYFKKLWKDTSKFMILSQIHSNNKHINGAWARAFDVNKVDIFASPNDVGWGPWSIESGWTVAEITSGLIFGLLDEALKNKFK